MFGAHYGSMSKHPPLERLRILTKMESDLAEVFEKIEEAELIGVYETLTSEWDFVILVKARTWEHALRGYKNYFKDVTDPFIASSSKTELFYTVKELYAP